MTANFLDGDILSLKNFLTAAKKFFREESGEIIGAYFDGEKIFVMRLTEKFETIELDADSYEIERLAEKIFLTCHQRGWTTSAVGFCLQDSDAVIYQTEAGNVPEKELPAMVKSWALAQAGKDAAYSFAKIGADLWMETLPHARLAEICAAFKKFGLTLRGLSVMPADTSAEVAPFDRTKFIAEVIRHKTAPNFLAVGDVWRWQRISQAAAAIFLIALTIVTAKTFWDYDTASDERDAAKLAVNELREDVALKKSLDDAVAELHRLNKSAAAQVTAPTKFNLLLNLGKIADKSIRLTKIRSDENSLELNGLANNPDAVKSYLARVKGSVAATARLESSTERDDGDIAFVIRAAL